MFYKDEIVYIITDVKNDIPIITGLLVDNKLQVYIID